jgi:predicted ArsR family transcriptional regulator
VSNDAAVAARVAAGDKVRRDIIAHIVANGPSTAAQIARNVHLGYDGVRHHLAILADTGTLVRGRYGLRQGYKWAEATDV